MDRLMIEGCLQTIQLQLSLIKQVLATVPMSAEEKEAHDLAEIGKVVRAEANKSYKSGKRSGREPDPNSKAGHVRAMCESLRVKGMSFDDIYFQVKKALPGSAHYQALHRWLRDNEIKKIKVA